MSFWTRARLLYTRMIRTREIYLHHIIYTMDYVRAAINKWRKCRLESEGGIWLIEPGSTRANCCCVQRAPGRLLHLITYRPYRAWVLLLVRKPNLSTSTSRRPVLAEHQRTVRFQTAPHRTVRFSNATEPIRTAPHRTAPLRRILQKCRVIQFSAQNGYGKSSSWPWQHSEESLTK